jgi:site-specific recombinase XerD
MADGLPAMASAPLSEGGPPPKLLDRVRAAVRLKHYSRRTEKAYVDWIRRYILFHQKKHPSTMGATELVAFLSWLAVDKQVSASTQNQALSAVLFLYREVLGFDIGPIEHVPRARMPDKLPVVLSREEVGQLLKQVDGTMWLIVAMLYGTGVRLEECLELRVRDLDFDRNQVMVRRGKGQKDRATMLPAGVKERLAAHLVAVKRRSMSAISCVAKDALCCLSRSIASTRPRRRSGAGSSSFRRHGSVEIRSGVHRLAFTCMNLSSRRR